MPEPVPSPIARLEQIPQEGFLEVEAEFEGAPESLVLYRDAAGVRGWLNICPHAGRRLDWAPGQFLKSREGQLVCAVHGAAFDLRDGLCVAGPCRGEALRAVGLRVEDDAVLLAGAAD
ncbi:MAG TPA: ferredoxin [Xanthomonadaceae bacterium]|nr:ferredoxin [Xanthomonadaceae bacterium]